MKYSRLQSVYYLSVRFLTIWLGRQLAAPRVKNIIDVKKRDIFFGLTISLENSKLENLA